MSKSAPRPSMPRSKFTAGTMLITVEIYKQVTQTTKLIPCPTELSVKEILTNVERFSLTQYPWGSHISNNSNFFIYNQMDENERLLAFDFDPNAPNILQLKASKMRQTLLKNLSDYFKKL